MFVGTQQRVTLGNTHYVDMVFYNKILKCYVLKNITVQGLLDRYMGCFPVSMLEIYKIIFDDDFIFENIQRTRCTDKMGSYKEKELEDILNKVLSDPLILNNPSYFFERVAKELSADEYRHLARLINN